MIAPHKKSSPDFENPAARSLALRSRVTSSNGILVAAAILLVLPSVLWAFRDLTVWSWDPASYANTALRNGQAARLGWQAWSDSLMGPAVTAPLLVWAAQAFVPLVYIVGRLETALLMTSVAFAALTLLMVGSVTLRLTHSRSATIAAVLACAGAPIFVGMSQTFFAEGPQIFAIAFLARTAQMAGRRSLVAVLPGLLLAASLAMLAKFSSFMVIAPFITYVFVACILARHVIKPPISVWLWTVELLLAVVVAVVTYRWYNFNWEYVIGHASRFSVSDLALLYGTKNALFVKLIYWGNNLSDALTVYRQAGILAAALVVIALVRQILAAIRGISAQQRADVVSSGLLFALCLAGTVVATLLAYSLQINEDPRFLSPLIPVSAILIGWSVRALGVTATKISVALLAANYCVVQLISAGPGGFLGNALYVSPPRKDAASIARLQNAVRQTCTSETYQITLLVAVSLPDMNENSLNFEQRKSARSRGFPCDYRSFPLYNTDIAKSVEQIDAIHANTVLTLPVEDLPSDKKHPYYFANVTAVPFAEWMANTPNFRRISPDGDSVTVYSRVLDKK